MDNTPENRAKEPSTRKTCCLFKYHKYNKNMPPNKMKEFPGIILKFFKMADIPININITPKRELLLFTQITPI